MTQEKIRRHATVQVTQEDLDKAKRNDSYKCVVSRAIARALPGATHIETDLQTIRFTRNGERFAFLTPMVVEGYVMAFDAGDPLAPFSFRLQNPVNVRQRKATEAGRAVHQKRSAAKRKAIQQAKAAGKKVDDPAVAASIRKAARDEYAKARQGLTTRLAESTPGRRVPRTLFKRKQRHYGHRELRINREKPTLSDHRYPDGGLSPRAAFHEMIAPDEPING